MTKTWPLMIRRFLAEPFEDFVFLIALIASLKQVSEPSSEKNTDFDVDQTFQWDREPSKLQTDCFEEDLIHEDP